MNLITGRDIVATDATAARAIEFDPKEISHIGNIDNIEVEGSRLEDVRQVFKKSQ
jgi:uncharacterized protein (DUF362 family)